MAKLEELADFPWCQCGNYENAGYQIQLGFGMQSDTPVTQCKNCGGFHKEGQEMQENKRPIHNTSGLTPLKRAVLTKPYKIEKVSKGGIQLVTQTVEREELAEQRAVIIEFGSEADCGIAKVGDHVMLSKWAGFQSIGPEDNEVYRIVNDRDIFLIIHNDGEGKEVK